MIEKLDPGYFDWLRWREGSPDDFCIPCREDALVGIRYRLKQHTVGYCNAERLLCRPKRDHKAVMFFKDGHHFWFHLSNREFERIYGIL